MRKIVFTSLVYCTGWTINSGHLFFGPSFLVDDRIFDRNSSLDSSIMERCFTKRINKKSFSPAKVGQKWTFNCRVNFADFVKTPSLAFLKIFLNGFFHSYRSCMSAIWVNALFGSKIGCKTAELRFFQNDTKNAFFYM